MGKRQGSGAGADDEGRPSFASFIKQTKQKEKGPEEPLGQHWKQDQDGHSSDERSEGSPAKPLTATEKSKLRRAQVRRAQIQHRQRKAEYVKQLELDVTHYRELVSSTETEVDELRKENESIRNQLRMAGMPMASPSSENQTAPPSIATQPPAEGLMTDAVPEEVLTSLETDIPMPMETDSPIIETQEVPGLKTEPQDVPGLKIEPQEPQALQEARNEAEYYDEVSIDDVVVSLKKDDSLGTPVLSISSASGGNVQETMVLVRQSQLSAEQERMAVNFILSLEHICWDHFFPGDQSQHPQITDVTDDAQGHALMASSICMNRAPEPVYTGRAQLEGSGATSSAPHPMKTLAAAVAEMARAAGIAQPPSATATSIGTSATAATAFPTDDTDATTSTPQSPSTALACTLRSTCSINPNGGPPVCFSWPAPPLSLGALRGLANSLTVGDSELTPVQAWFELADRFPPAVLLHPSVHSALLRELNTVVQCLRFGAVMDREAFERAVQRVLGPSLEGMMARFAIDQRRYRPNNDGRQVLAN